MFAGVFRRRAHRYIVGDHRGFRLDIDTEVRECFGDVDPCTPVLEVEPGWYEVVVYRTASAEPGPPFFALVHLDKEPAGESRPLCVGFPIVKKKKKAKKKKNAN